MKNATFARIIQELGLSHITLEISFKTEWEKEHKYAAALQYAMKERGKKREHFVEINIPALFEEGSRELDSLIVHELIHVWQDENMRPGYKIHGRKFQEWAVKLEAITGFRNIYMKGVDV